MNRADPFDQFDGLGDGTVDVLKSGQRRQALQPVGPQPADRHLRRSSKSGIKGGGAARPTEA